MRYLMRFRAAISKIPKFPFFFAFSQEARKVFAERVFLNQTLNNDCNSFAEHQRNVNLSMSMIEERKKKRCVNSPREKHFNIYISKVQRIYRYI